MFKTRSYKKELLDESDIPRDSLFQNLKELAFINTYLGGHAITVAGLEMLITDTTKVYNLIDIGSGGGDSAKAIITWAQKKKMQIRLTGIDLKPDCITYAKEHCRNYPELIFTCDDFRNVFSQKNKIDLVHASLFCHHFTETEIIDFVKLCSANNAIFLINDLERNAIAYYAIKFLTRLFSKTVLVKNDAPLSVLRGFKKKEWIEIIKKSGIKKYSIQNKWAFRHLVIIYPNE
ncbi:MAG: methyltransferase domain-containing protein [Bacteroidetes bacterium]|nr:methyltransferase domain-containing protein [Bacteroidota bacterium]